MLKPKYYLVERTLLPEVFQRVIEANEAIASGKAATASEAAKLAGLSRSAYYKYYTGQDWDNAKNYDLSLNSEQLGFEKCVEIIKGYLKVRFD